MTTDGTNKKIRIPLSRRWRLWRRRFLPFLIWLVAVGIVTHLMQQRTQRVNVAAIVDGQLTSVVSLVDGPLRSVTVDLFEEVQAGQVVGVMDDTAIQAELIRARTELSQLRASLNAAVVTTERDLDTQEFQELNSLRLFIRNEEQARLDVLDRIVQHEMDKATFQRLSVQLEHLKPLTQDQHIDMLTYDNIRLQYEALETKIKENETAIAAAQKLLGTAKRRRQEREGELYANVDASRLLQPYREAVQVQEKRIDEVVVRQQQLILTSPIAGKVTQILRRPGEAVVAGDPLINIASAQSSRLIAYVSEDMVDDIHQGQDVELYSLHQPQEVFEAKVIRISAAVEEVPIRLRRNPMLPEWGLPVMVGYLPDDATKMYYPGERFHLRFLSLP